MKSILLSFIFAMLTVNLFAQQQTFDIVSYNAPKDWSEKKGEGNITYSRIDGASWAQIAIYQHRNCEGDIQTDFDKDWNELVASNKTIDAPEKTEPKTTDGWTVMSGSGVWKYNDANVATILTVYSNNKICVAVLCNATAQPYLKNYKDLISSLDIDAGKIQETSNTGDNSNTSIQEVNTNNLSNSSVVGIWVTNIAEDRGYINGFRMYTGGYMRKEYQIKEDGTYIFREKDWRAVNETIYFVYESGTWTMNGNKLTITPKKGKAGWWNKDNITNDVNKWGNFQKAAAYKIQPASYTIEIKTDSYYGNSIILNSNKATERDGGQFNDPPYRFAYSQRKETLIDNPPGFKN